MHHKKHEQQKRRYAYKEYGHGHLQPKTHERITRAAIRHNAYNYSLPPPNRHADVMRASGIRYGKYRIFNGEQGFMTSYDRFVDREAAHKIAKKAGQLIVRRDGHLYDRDGAQLFSEDLW